MVFIVSKRVLLDGFLNQRALQRGADKMNQGIRLVASIILMSTPFENSY